MKNKHLRLIVALHKEFLAGNIPGPSQHEVHPNLPISSRENYLYFTLPCALNFQRNSPNLWRSALETYNDPQTNYLFFPEKVVQRTEDEVRMDMVKHKLALQPNKHTNIWYRLSKTLAQNYNSDPRVFLDEHRFDVLRIISTIQITRKNQFPYLSGIKLSNYWLFILSHFTDVDFTNKHEISIIPDTHVIKSSIRLGVVKEDSTSKDVEAAWRPILKELDISPIEMHSALWRWSRNEFNPTID